MAARLPTTWTVQIAAVLLCLSVSGCRLMRHDDVLRYETVAVDPTRDTQAAVLYHERALKIIERASNPALCHCECVAGCLCDLHKAEKLLEKALLADVRYGPAHNTLGMLYYYQQKLYLAAWEFEYAARLMPDYAEPINNQGMVYEAAERLDRAIEYYEMALELDPNNPVYLGNLAKAQLRMGSDVEMVRGILKEMIFFDSRPDWIAWARDTLGENPVEFASAELDDEEESSSDPPDSEPLPLPEAEPTLDDSEPYGADELSFPEFSPAAPDGRWLSGIRPEGVLFNMG